MASKASKLRIVRCPKCRLLLTEFPDVPVYRCGGCGAVLQAKNPQANKGNGASQMLGLIPSEKNLLQHVSESGGTMNDESTLSNRQAALSTMDSNHTDIDHVGEHKHIAGPSEKALFADSENSHHKQEVSVECTENVNVEACLTDDNDNASSTGQDDMPELETISVASDQRGRSVQVNTDCCSNEQVDDSWNLSEHGSVNSCSSCKIDGTESNLASEEDIADAHPGNISCQKMNTPTVRDAHACDGNDPSYDGISNSREQYVFSSSAVRNKEVSDSENSCHKQEESVECTENANMEACLTDDNDNASSTGQDEMPELETISVASDQQGRSVQVNTDCCSIEQLDDSWKLSEHGSVNSCSSRKMDGMKSSLASEDIADAHPGHISCEKMNTPTVRDAHACDGNDPSYDGISNSHEQYLFSSSAVRNKEVSDCNDTNEKDAKENTLLENMEDSNSHLQSRSLSSNSSDEGHASLAILGLSDLNQRLSSNHAYHRENSRHSEIFHSARKEWEDGSLSVSLSRDSSFQKLPCNGRNDSPTRHRSLGNDRMELLRKVDELRDHLTRPYAQGRGGNRRFHILGTKKDSHRPFFSNHGSEQVLECSKTNITQSNSRFSGQRAIAQPYRVPFSGQGNNSCLHHHPEDWCIPLQLPHHSCCRGCTYHVFCHPSHLSSPGFCKDCDVALYSHKGQTSDQHFEKMHSKEKRQPLKRHCRPVLGGAPFVICNNCERLLQLPADFLVSRARYHKLKCGGCSEVLIFLSHGGGRIIPHSGTQLVPAPSEIDNATEHVRRPELSVDHSSGRLHGDPVSYSEEYGPPFSYGYSTDGEPVPHIFRSSVEQDRRHGKQATGAVLHRLMGYDSATELMYQPSDVDEAYESREMAPFYRTSTEIHFSEVHGGTGHSEIECSPEQTEKHKQDGCVDKSASPREGSPLHVFFKKGIKELNHGLESMKQKLHTGGRAIPAP